MRFENAGSFLIPSLAAALGGTTAYMYFLAALFFVFAFGFATFLQHHHYNAVRCVLLVRTGLISAFYRKSVRLTLAARAQLTIGLIMTMCAVRVCACVCCRLPCVF